MCKQGIAILTLFSFMFQLFGCYSITTLEINKVNLDEIKDSEIKAVISKDAEVYEFEINEQNPKPSFVDSTLIGWIKTKSADDSSHATEVQLSLSNIKTIQYEKNDTALVLGICVGTIGIGLIVYGVFYFINHTKLDLPMGGNPLRDAKF